MKVHDVFVFLYKYEQNDAEQTKQQKKLDKQLQPTPTDNTKVKTPSIASKLEPQTTGITVTESYDPNFKQNMYFVKLPDNQANLLFDAVKAPLAPFMGSFWTGVAVDAPLVLVALYLDSKFVPTLEFWKRTDRAQIENLMVGSINNSAKYGNMLNMLFESTVRPAVNEVDAKSKPVRDFVDTAKDDYTIVEADVSSGRKNTNQDRVTRPADNIISRVESKLNLFQAKINAFINSEGYDQTHQLRFNFTIDPTIPGNEGHLNIEDVCHDPLADYASIMNSINQEIMLQLNQFKSNFGDSNQMFRVVTRAGRVSQAIEDDLVKQTVDNLANQPGIFDPRAAFPVNWQLQLNAIENNVNMWLIPTLEAEAASVGYTTPGRGNIRFAFDMNAINDVMRDGHTTGPMPVPDSRIIGNINVEISRQLRNYSTNILDDFLVTSKMPVDTRKIVESLTRGTAPNDFIAFFNTFNDQLRMEFRNRIVDYVGTQALPINTIIPVDKLREIFYETIYSVMSKSDYLLPTTDGAGLRISEVFKTQDNFKKFMESNTDFSSLPEIRLRVGLLNQMGYDWLDKTLSKMGGFWPTARNFLTTWFILSFVANTLYGVFAPSESSSSSGGKANYGSSGSTNVPDFMNKESIQQNLAIYPNLSTFLSNAKISQQLALSKDLQKALEDSNVCASLETALQNPTVKSMILADPSLMQLFSNGKNKLKNMVIEKYANQFAPYLGSLSTYKPVFDAMSTGNQNFYVSADKSRFIPYNFQPLVAQDAPAVAQPNALQPNQPQQNAAPTPTTSKIAAPHSYGAYVPGASMDYNYQFTIQPNNLAGHSTVGVPGVYLTKGQITDGYQNTIGTYNKGDKISMAIWLDAQNSQYNIWVENQTSGKVYQGINVVIDQRCTEKDRITHNPGEYSFAQGVYVSPQIYEAANKVAAFSEFAKNSQIGEYMKTNYPQFYNALK